ncbi:hypothetical protein AK812_SmicGene283 [Symbiodinium microadriaticum]|uniref:Uncharacterized protein n=1 Tax=Symbiodinium microadriaticum TaxID=2951 RepID=A0A1Q9F730_SYMMI|nr:hypothetical protein AK812_SmicGene283 [Symbiodinium microadriaticum]
MSSRRPPKRSSVQPNCRDPGLVGGPTGTAPGFELVADMAPTPGTLRPGVGFCLQAKSSGTPPGRWFLNMTMHKLVEMPRAYSGQKVTKEWILANGIANLQVPFDMGSFRLFAGACQSSFKQFFYGIALKDVVFNPLIVQLFIDDGFCNAMGPLEFKPTAERKSD